jgi:hypothetical protein
MSWKILFIAIEIMILACPSVGAKACFRGRPLPDCESFWLTESGVFWRFDRKASRDWHERLLYSIEIGLMKNRCECSALGGTVMLAFEDMTNDFRLAFKGRYRRWLSQKHSVDIAPGIYLTGSKTDFPSFTTSVSLNAADYFALVGVLDILKSEKGGGTDFAWFGGIRFGSEPGLIIAIAGPIFALIAVADSLSDKPMVDW